MFSIVLALYFSQRIVRQPHHFAPMFSFVQRIHGLTILQMQVELQQKKKEIKQTTLFLFFGFDNIFFFMIIDQTGKT